MDDANKESEGESESAADKIDDADMESEAESESAASGKDTKEELPKEERGENSSSAASEEEDYQASQTHIQQSEQRDNTTTVR